MALASRVVAALRAEVGMVGVCRSALAGAWCEEASTLRAPKLDESLC
jgi:hypothetical protein